MTVVAIVILSVAAALFLARLIVGPTVADRVVAFDGLLITVMCGILVAVARGDFTSVDAVLLIALVGFVGTGVLARYVERRGG